MRVSGGWGGNTPTLSEVSTNRKPLGRGRSLKMEVVGLAHTVTLRAEQIHVWTGILNLTGKQFPFSTCPIKLVQDVNGWPYTSVLKKP